MNKMTISDFIDGIGDGIHGTPIYSSNGEYFFINGNNLKDGVMALSDDTLRISESEFQRIKRPLSKNSILISINGTIGNVSLYNGEKVALGKSACYINVKPDEDRYYIKTVLTTKMFLQYALRVAHGSTIKNLAPTQIAEYSFEAPERKERDKIAYTIRCIDDKINLNKRINAELEAMAKSIYDYWFTQFDFPDENGKPYRTSGGKMEWNEQLKREIPKGWNVGRLENVANIIMGQSPSGDSYNEQGVGKVFFQGSTDFGIDYPSTRVYTTKPSRIAQKGDILLSVRAPVGTMNVAFEECCIGRGLAALNSKIGANTYLHCLILALKKRFDVINGNGTTFGSLTKDSLFEIATLIPSDNIVKSFESVVQNYSNERFNNEKQIRELTALRDWLLPMLMNGQATVK